MMIDTGLSGAKLHDMWGGFIDRAPTFWIVHSWAGRLSIGLLEQAQEEEKGSMGIYWSPLRGQQWMCHGCATNMHHNRPGYAIISLKEFLLFH
jgi:hypothetical protein